MDIEELMLIVSNVAGTPDGFKFIEILLDKLGAFERGANLQNSELEAYNKGRREQGLWLLDLLRDSHFDRFTELQRKRSNLWKQRNKQKKKQQEQD